MAEHLFGKFGSLSQTAASALRVRSALNPILWLIGIATPTCLIAALMFKDYEALMVYLVFAGLIPIPVACIVFIYFAIFKPEKLQSEDYQIRHESLQIIQQKSGSVDVTGASLEQIANPNVRRIDDMEGR